MTKPFIELNEAYERGMLARAEKPADPPDEYEMAISSIVSTDDDELELLHEFANKCRMKDREIIRLRETIYANERRMIVLSQIFVEMKNSLGRI